MRKEGDTRVKKISIVEVVAYKHVWKEKYRQIKEHLLAHVGDLVLACEHVGSTSVEGLAAKPIIDLDLVMESYDQLPEIILRLQQIGYVHEGTLGIEGREAFRRETAGSFMNHHLYVCPKDGKGYLEHIAFRDYLRGNGEACRQYGELKQRLAEQYRTDRAAYGEAKTAFITSILNMDDLS
ncbi:GrpB family protein [Paenibacillus albidus]|nr:GrpB family protein [Paenibacillus albidus]